MEVFNLYQQALAWQKSTFLKNIKREINEYFEAN